MTFRKVLCCLPVLGLCLAAPPARAQSSSLYGEAGQRRPLRLSDSSWYYLEPEPPRAIQKYDLVTVIVKEATQFVSEGEINRRTQSNVDARLRDWIKLDGTDITPAPQTSGDPRARASLDSQIRTQSELETRDGLQFRITATVVDIRPNGLLVLEAHKRTKVNNEESIQILSGIVRPEDVLPNNTVLSERIAELRIDKKEAGHIRDAYRRGWLIKWLDKVRPF
ncbi:MAG: flagellar basal body L-ring protein FlgH [Pirellulales bacterium]|nr:flagellar basal body L-ring protein FlgH [Pirellulales bacterium]